MNKNLYFLAIGGFVELKEQVGDITKICYTGDDIHIGDKYHTMDELYDHRRALTTALLNVISNECGGSSDPTFKSKLHSDGTMFDGYFICGFKYQDSMISYHYDLKYWDDFRIPELERAPEYDGHTSQDVIERLLKL